MEGECWNKVLFIEYNILSVRLNFSCEDYRLGEEEHGYIFVVIVVAKCSNFSRRCNVGNVI